MRSNRMACFVVGTGLIVGAGSAGAAQWRDGAHVYEKVCRYCHEANVGPVLQGRSLPTEYIQRVVRHGNRAMPAFRPSEIDDAALADVARLINASAARATE